MVRQFSKQGEPVRPGDTLTAYNDSGEERNVTELRLDTFIAVTSAPNENKLAIASDKASHNAAIMLRHTRRIMGTMPQRGN